MDGLVHILVQKKNLYWLGLPYVPASDMPFRPPTALRLQLIHPLHTIQAFKIAQKQESVLVTQQ